MMKPRFLAGIYLVADQPLSLPENTRGKEEGKSQSCDRMRS